jgi:predicted ATPase
MSAGWHVIIGDNGAGKSTVLRSIALALIGPAEPGALRQDWQTWMRSDAEDESHVKIQVIQHEEHDRWTKSAGRTTEKDISGEMVISLDEESGLPKLAYSGKKNAKKDPARTLWARGQGNGWFSAGYGPFRRFEGGDQESSKNFYAYPEVARHLSLFGESVALTEALDWLKRLKHQKLELGQVVGFVDRIKNFVNTDGLLPHGTKLLDVTFDKVTFIDGNGASVAVGLLGDGFRAILSMTFELLRQLEREYGQEKIFSDTHPDTVNVPGIVLIDEVDAHLHPSWQRQIGQWFTKHFPFIQFIVTTHSPLVCWSVNQGTIFRLPAPGSGESSRMIEGEEKLRLVSGTVQDAYGTELFGLDLDRAPEAQALLEELAELNTKGLAETLSHEEISRQAELKKQLPHTAYSLI